MIRTLIRRLAALLVVALPAAGCVDIEYGVALEEDLSGEMELAVGLNPDQMAYGMAMMQRSFQGEEGAPTEEEIAAARERIMADIQEQREEFDMEEIRSEAREDLPDGMEVVDVQQDEQGLSTRIVLSFDHVRQLTEMSISPESGEAEGPRRMKADVQPFSGLVFEDEGDTFLLTNEPIDPVAQADSRATGMQGMGQQFLTMMRGMQGEEAEPLVTFWLDVPAEVVEHNATRVEGSRLYWEYGLQSFGQDEEPASIRARFRKP